MGQGSVKSDIKTRKIIVFQIKKWVIFKLGIENDYIILYCVNYICNDIFKITIKFYELIQIISHDLIVIQASTLYNDACF